VGVTDEDVPVVLGRRHETSVRADGRRPLPRDPSRSLVERAESRAQRAEPKRSVDVLSDLGHDRGAIPAPSMGRQGRDPLDVPGREPVAAGVQVSLDHGRMRHDPPVRLHHEMHPTERVLEVLVREGILRIRPRGVEERAEGSDLSGRQFAAREPPHDRHRACLLRPSIRQSDQTAPGGGIIGSPDRDRRRSAVGLSPTPPGVRVGAPGGR